MNRRAGRDRGRDYRNSNNYNDHDDRVGGPHDGARRVQFKHPVGKDRRNKRQTGWDTKHIRSLILSNDDIDMSSTVTDRRLGGDRQNKGRQQQPMDRRGGGRGKKNLKYMATGYYRVDIRGGGRFTRDYLLKIIASHLKPTPLLPLQVKVVNNDFQFTLEDYDTAVKVMNAHHQITLSNGWRINIHVRPFTPTIELDEKLTAVMKTALASRYQIATKALDLSHFQMDPAFISEEIICPLNRPDVMSYVLELISDYVPDLVALNLDRNNIAAVDHLKVMIDKFPNLRILHMANNLIRDVKQLDSLKGLKLEEVNLDGNSLASSFNDKDTYIREIRQRFPKVIKLDGIDLPKPITFDLEDVEETHVPKSQMTFMCDPGPGAEMARKFIEQYFQVFDSIDRSLLLAAYHDNAHFSMQCCLAPSEVHSMFSGYMPENRNLLRATTLERRLKLLKIGKQSIIETLKDFPATAHELMSFVVDLVYFTPELIQLVVGGLYKELKKVNNTGTGIKYFNRVFLIVPVGGGFCIVNEELTIMYPTAAQIKSINSKPKDLVVVPPVPSVAGSPSVAGIDGGSNEMALKRQMITEMAAKSGMNLGWSEKCLAETNWNFDQAVFAFTQLRDSNQIPPEAFLP